MKQQIIIMFLFITDITSPGPLATLSKTLFESFTLKRYIWEIRMKQKIIIMFFFITDITLPFTGPCSDYHSAKSLFIMFMNIINWGPQIRHANPNARRFNEIFVLRAAIMSKQ